MAEVISPGMTPSEVQALLPQPSTTTPPSVADTGQIGSDLRYALANHTHASKARKIRVQTAADGSFTWVFNVPFTTGTVPIIVGIAEAPNGSTDVYNLQLVAPPTNTQAQILVNRVQRSVAAVLGLTVLSVPSTPGVTWVDLIALEP